MIIGTPDSAEGLTGFLEEKSPNDPPPDKILKSASSLNAAETLEELAQLQREDMDDGSGDPEDIETLREFQESLEGEWLNEAQPNLELAIKCDLETGEFIDEVVIALVPVTEAAAIPAVPGFGAFNDCPEPAAHVAIHRYWNERYGAEIVARSEDYIECSIARPPATREAAINLAREHYAYCYDIVEQGTETISTLSAMLLDNPTWFFWWD